MKKLFILFFLSISIALMGGCNKIIDDNSDIKVVDKEEDIDIDIEEDNEMDEPVEPTKPIEPTVSAPEKEKIIYVNEEYGFTLDIPSWWKDIYRVENGIWIDETSKSVSFNFGSEGVSSNVFTIIVLNEKIGEEDWEDPILTYMLEHNGKTYSYLPSMEPTEELLEEENKRHLETVSKMVEEVPEIVETFTIIK